MSRRRKTMFVVDEPQQMRSPPTPAEAYAYAQAHPLPETRAAMASLAQCILGRGTHNTLELREGFFAAVRAQLREAR